MRAKSGTKIHKTLKIKNIKSKKKNHAKEKNVEKVWNVWKNSTTHCGIHCGIPYCFILL